MENFQFLEILILAAVAGFLAFKLYTVLGKRTGNERSPDDRLGPLSRRAETAPQVLQKEPAAAPTVVEAPTNPVAAALVDIKLADRTFDTDKFLSGARAAYEMIVTAFAKGDRPTLQQLLSDDVYHTFDAAIRAREAKKERVEFNFQALKSARITGAELKNRSAEITVTFESQFMLAGYDAEGKLIEGDARTPHVVTDIWTFARETVSANPNWTLVATASG
jgi:predicted lipid-binding transport protein (Tim44 family)